MRRPHSLSVLAGLLLLAATVPVAAGTPPPIPEINTDQILSSAPSEGRTQNRGAAPAGAVLAAPQPTDESKKMKLVGNSPGNAFTNSDLAFWGDRAYAGNYGGFRIIDISDPTDPTEVTDFSCPGPQNDISVYNSDADPAADLLFLSVDSIRSDDSCASTGTTYAMDSDAWEGVRIFDINTESAPFQVKAVPTDCGSHTHTLVPDPDNPANLYIYVSSYPLGLAAVGGPSSRGQECFEPHAKISIITVPLASPAAATVTERALDGATYETARSMSVSPAPPPGQVSQVVQRFKGCHDIAVFIELNLAAAACWMEGQFWDISNPVAPVLLRRVRDDTHISDLYHSATFTWDGEFVVFEDEAGGGGAARCLDPEDPQGRVLMYDTSANLVGTFKIPRAQQKPCTAHNYVFVPVKNKYILVSAWYDGGNSVIDFTDPDKAKEIAFFDAGAPLFSDTWSSYWYNGFVYANDGLCRGVAPPCEGDERGFDVYDVDIGELKKAETLDHLNPQTQEEVLFG